MRVRKVDYDHTVFKNNNHNVNWVSLTGYSSIGCGTASLICAKSKQYNAHKVFGIASVLFAFAHVGKILSYKLKYN